MKAPGHVGRCLAEAQSKAVILTDLFYQNYFYSLKCSVRNTNVDEYFVTFVKTSFKNFDES